MLERKLKEKSETQEVTGANLSQSKKHFTEPKLAFVEPRLTKYGDATKIITGAFGSFSP